MNTIIVTTVSLVLFSTLSMGEIKYLSKSKIMELSSTSKVLKNKYTKVLEAIDEKDTYFFNLEYKGKQVNAFMDKKTGVVYRGDRFDAKGTLSKFIKSPERIAHFQKMMKNGISFSVGTGKKDLYVFTDPECPYCKKFEKLSQGLLDDYTVHTILFPLRFHKKAPAMVEWIMQGKDDNEKHTRLVNVMLKNDQTYMSVLPKKGERFQYSNKVAKKLNDGKIIARQLNVRGTPIIFDTDLNKLNWGKLLQEERNKKNNIRPFKALN